MSRPLHARSRAAVLALAAAAATVLLQAAAPAAAAHPLGNFTVNHYDGFTFHRDHIAVTAVVDRAEISAAQERPRVDADHDGTVDAGERAAHARRGCADLAGALTARIDGAAVHWQVTDSTFGYRPGQAGLKTSRLECALTAPADLHAPADVELRDDYAAARVGWHEMTARGKGVALESSPLPTVSVTHELRRYPQDLLADPLDRRAASFTVHPAAGDSPLRLPSALPGAGPVTAALGHVTAVFDSLVGARELTLSVGLLALALSLVLGASHAAMPGHGKTIMAAYLAGRQGGVRDAVTVGATVTVTHTAGVLVLGLVLPLATHLAGEAVLAWLGILSGLLVSAIGVRLLRGTGHEHGHGHHHGHSHSHDHGPDGHRHPHGHSHAVPHARQAPPADGHGKVVLLDRPHTHEHHDHPHRAGHHRFGKRGLVGVGIAGGLVPSPSALVVLLGAVALGRTAFGVLLVLGYGLGMALTLTAAGVALVRFRDTLAGSSRLRRLAGARTTGRIRRWSPVLTACLVLLVGLALTVRALAGVV